MLEESGPHLLLEAGGDAQIEIIGNVDAADEAAHPGTLLVERKDARERSRVIRDREELERSPAQKSAGPGGLPLPGEEERGMLRAVQQCVPARLVEGLEARERLNLHRSLRHRSLRHRSSSPRRRDPPGPRYPPRKPRPWRPRDRRRGPPPSPLPCA